MPLSLLKKTKKILHQHNIIPKHYLGQNFLIDKEVLYDIVNAADIKETDTVLEIGPGLGVLTRELIQYAKEVVVIETDPRFVRILKQEFGQRRDSGGNKKKACRGRELRIIEGDVLKTDFNTLGLMDRRYKIVANLPYQISSHFLQMVLSKKPRPSEMIVMVQKEVAERIVAGPGKMSLLSVSVQFYSKPRLVRVVNSNSFFPQPEVDSAVVKFIAIGKQYDVDEKKFFKLVKIGFTARRKQLHNNLSGCLRVKNEEIKKILKKIGLSENIRAQDLSIENWLELYQHLNFNRG